MNKNKKYVTNFYKIYVFIVNKIKNLVTNYFIKYIDCEICKTYENINLLEYAILPLRHITKKILQYHRSAGVKTTEEKNPEKIRF